jgi:hypothetical protein
MQLINREARNLMYRADQAATRGDLGEWQIRVCQAWVLINHGWLIVTGNANELVEMEACHTFDALQAKMQRRIENLIDPKTGRDQAF